MGLKNTKNKLENEFENGRHLTEEELQAFANAIEMLEKEEEQRSKGNFIEYIIIFILVLFFSSLMLTLFWNIVMTKLFVELPEFTFIQGLMVNTFMLLFLTIANKIVNWINIKLSQLMFRG